MVQWGLMFGALICQIGSSGIPIVTEFIPMLPVEDLVEARFYGCVAFGDDGNFCDPSGS